MKETQLTELSNLLLEVAGDPGKWNLVIETLVRAFDARKGGLEFSDLENGRCNIQADYGLGPAFREQYQRHFGPANPFKELRSLLKSGSVFTTAQMIPMEELRQTEFYRDFLRPQGIEHLLCTVLFHERDLFGFLNLARPKEMRPFGSHEIALMQSILPHLQQALLVNRTIAQLESERTISNGLLDHLSRGVVLLDARGKVILLNRAALSILEGRDGLMFEESGIRAVVPEENQRLKHLLQSALTGEPPANGIPDGLLLVSRTGSESPLAVLIAPLGRNLPLIEEPRARAVVFISDPERCPASAEQVMRGLYSFTEAEARLAGCLLKGLSLEECSGHLGITLNTTRTHLKRLFLKTATNRQGELIRVLLESPAMLHLGHS